MREWLAEEQMKCQAMQIELDAQRQVNSDVMIQLEDQQALYRTVRTHVS